MPTIRVKEHEAPEVALRRFKRTVEKAGILTETKKREYFEKPTEKRKRRFAAAVKRHWKRVMRDNPFAMNKKGRPTRKH